jgi:maleate isomerase
MAARRFRIGMLTPSSNTALEPVTCDILQGRRDVSVHFSRFTVMGTSLDPASNAQFKDEAFLNAAKLLADARVDVIAWNGTSGSWLGLNGDRRLCNYLEDATGIPTTTSTLALFDAFALYGVRRYSMAVPYVRDHAEKIVETYRAEGLECVAFDNFGCLTNREIDEISGERILKQLGSVAVPGSQAIAVICTNVPAAPFAEQVEKQFGIPVLDSIAVTAWKTLRMLGVDAKIEGWSAVVIMISDVKAQVSLILSALLEATKASRTTFRVDIPAENISVQVPLAEAAAAGIPSMLTDGSLKQRESPTCQWLEKHRKPLVQDDLEHADPAPPRALIDAYGAKAQMLAPVEDEGAMIGWVSVHYAPGPRHWMPAEISALEDAARRIGDVVRSET